jgi:hypothetical protein
MSSKLFNFYSFDECSDEDQLFEKLDSLKDESKIEYTEQDNYIVKIKDLELSDDEISELLKFFDNLNVYPYLGIEDDDDDEFSDFDDGFAEDDDDDYNGSYKSKKGKSNDDDYYDDF